jgi:transposase
MIRKLKKASSTESAIVFGMDVHSNSYTVTVAHEGKLQAGPKKITGVTVDDKVEQVMRWVKEYPSEHNIVLNYEAGCFGYSISDSIEYAAKSAGIAQRVRVDIIAPSHIEQSQSDRKQKTDKRDSRNLAILGSLGRLKSIHKLSKRERSLRTYLRMREQVMEDVSNKKRQIGSFLLSLGVSKPSGMNSWTVKHEAWLTALDLGDELLTETFKELFNCYRQAADNLKRFEKRIVELGKTSWVKPIVRRLHSVFGIGDLTSLSIVAELGADMSRFKSSKKLASFVGLTPSEHSSGESRRQGHITRSGNARLRRLLVECSWILLRKDKELSDFFDRVSAGNKHRKKAIVAVARKLLVRIHAMLIKGEDYKIKETFIRN